MCDVCPAPAHHRVRTRAVQALDPRSASAVLLSGRPISLVGWEAATEARFTGADATALKAAGKTLLTARVLGALEFHARITDDPRLVLPDAVAVAAVVAPHLLRMEVGWGVTRATCGLWSALLTRHVRRGRRQAAKAWLAIEAADPVYPECVPCVRAPHYGKRQQGVFLNVAVEPPPGVPGTNVQFAAGASDDMHDFILRRLLAAA